MSVATPASSIFPPGAGHFYVASDRTKLYFEAWSPPPPVDAPSTAPPNPNAAKANILYLHGVNESADTIHVRRMAEAFSPHFNFLCLEPHGHGRSDGRRGLVENFGKLLDHTREFVDKVLSSWTVAKMNPYPLSGSGPRGEEVRKEDDLQASFSERTKNVEDGCEYEYDSRFQTYMQVRRYRGKTPTSNSTTIADGENQCSLPFLVVGHSMGGAQAIFLGDFFQKFYPHQFLGALLLAPSIAGPTPPLIVRGALRGLAALLPSLSVGPPEHVEEYDTGSGWGLNYDGKMRASTARMFVDLFVDVRSAVEAAAARQAAGAETYWQFWRGGVEQGGRNDLLFSVHKNCTIMQIVYDILVHCSSC